MNGSARFWIATGLVVINAGIACFAPTSELRLNATMTAGVCALAAFVFWLYSNKAEDQ